MKLYVIMFIAISLFTVHQAHAIEDYFYVRGGLGQNFMFNENFVNMWNDGGGIGGTVGAGYVRRLSGDLYGSFSYNHYSQPGVPSCCETTTDHVYFGIEYRWY